MTEQVEHLILEYLRSIRGDIGIMKDDIRELKLRMTSLEMHVATLRSCHSNERESIESTRASAASNTASN